MTPESAVWGAAGALFVIGFAGTVLRRQLLAMLLGVELMTNAANLPLVYYAVSRQDGTALAAAFLVLAVAACEAVVGLTLILSTRKLGLPAESSSLKELWG